MMRCKEANNLFTAYLDGEVTQNEKESMEAHLAACPTCRKERAEMSKTQAKLKQTLEMAAGVNPPPETWSRLRQQILDDNQEAVARVLPQQGSFWKRMGKSFVIPKRLTWKTATAGVLAGVLIVSMAIALPTLTGHSKKLSAAEIALADPAVQAALGNGSSASPTIADVMQQFRNTFVVLERNRDIIIVVQLDSDTGEVIHNWIWNITEEEKQKVMNIASSSSDVQQLLAQGATFRGFTPFYSTHSSFDSEGQPYVDNFDFKATVLMEQDNKTHYVEVSLNEGRVTNLFSVQKPYWYSCFAYIVYAVLAALIILNILVLIGMKRGNTQAINHANDVSIVSGMVSVSGLLFVFTRLTAAFWLLGLPLSVISLAVGITWLRYKMPVKRQWHNAASSLILSSLAVILGVMLILSEVTSWNGTSVIPF